MITLYRFSNHTLQTYEINEIGYEVTACEDVPGLFAAKRNTDYRSNFVSYGYRTIDEALAEEMDKTENAVRFLKKHLAMLKRRVSRL